MSAISCKTIDRIFTKILPEIYLPTWKTEGGPIEILKGLINIARQGIFAQFAHVSGKTDRIFIKFLP